MRHTPSFFSSLLFALLAIAGRAVAQTQFDEPTRLFLMHHSGNHLKRGADGTGRLEAATANKPQQVTFIPNEDGYYSIKADGHDLYLTIKDQWSTTFSNDATSSNALFSIEGVDDRLIKLRCKANGKYLGTDGNGAGSYIYADKNGNPAAYSKENIPLNTPKFLNISLAGFEQGDFAMIMGFPGSTSRYLTGDEVKQRMFQENEPRIAMRDVTLNIIREEMAKSEDIAIRYANKQARISNYWKNSIGMNKAIVDNKVVETKLAKETAFKTWAKQNGKNEYVDVVEKINACVEQANRTTYLTTLATELISCVEFIQRNIYEEANMFNDPKLTQDQMNAFYGWLHNRDYDHEIDRRIAKEVLPLYFSLTQPEERDAHLNEMYAKYKGNLEKYIDDVYNKSILANKKNFDRFMKKPSAKKFEKDPAMQLRAAVFRTYRALVAKESEIAKVINPLHKTYLKGLMEMTNGPVYPDANFTMRLTYGNVKPYNPKDGVTYNYYTTLKGVMEKEDPTSSEFVVPARLKELYEAKDFGQYALPNGEMPVAFLTTNDITGGNSGSGVLNARGELIGLAFDGNWESLSGDINFDDNLQRCINVDIRYVLFVIDKFGGCNRLIEELNIVK